MTLEELKKTPTVTLINYLSESLEKGEQGIANMFAYEIATRIYVPNNSNGITFDKLLSDFGYKSLEEDKSKKLKLR